MSKQKILISAYACEPDKGSEPGVGWHWAKQIARFHEVWVITRSNNQVSIEKELANNPDENLHFIYCDIPKWLSFWKKKERGLYLYYLLWQLDSYLVARRLVAIQQFDIVHYLTFGTILLPTFIAFLPIPLVFGPVGGGERIPRKFRANYSFKNKAYELLRDIILLFMKFNPLFLYTCKRASSIIVRTEDTLRQIPMQHHHKTVKILETGHTPQSGTTVKPDRIGTTLRIVYIGRLLHLKGIDLALNAFANASKQFKDIELVIIGDGPERKRLTELCRQLGVSGHVHFTGHISKDRVHHMLRTSSIFLFPSLKEGGAWVLFEAMENSIPVICLDIAGPAEIVSNDSGIKVKPINPEQTINDLTEALRLLITDDNLRKTIGAAGRRRVETVYNWDTKGELVNKIYAACI